MNKPLKILIIEDSENDADLLRLHLKRGGYDLKYRRVDTAGELTEALANEKWDIIFSDHNMPGFNSTVALEMVRAVNPDVPFLIVSGSIAEESAVEAMKAGAQDYLMKGNFTRLVAAVERELKEAEDRQARRVAERSLLAKEEELRIAREVQQRLFPRAAPVIAGYEIAGASCPAEATGGDYYDYIDGPDGAVFIVVGDVTGHGLGSALLMADVRAYLRSLVLANRNLEEIVDQARLLLRKDLGEDRFITLLFAQLVPASGLLDFINAGHPNGYVFAQDGRVRDELSAKASALGIDVEQGRVLPTRVMVEKGDLVFLCTDGVLEALSPSGEEFGEARVLEIVRREMSRPPAEMIRVLFEEVRHFSGTDQLLDDITAVVVKRLAWS